MFNSTKNKLIIIKMRIIKIVLTIMILLSSFIFIYNINKPDEAIVFTTMFIIAYIMFIALPIYYLITKQFYKYSSIKLKNGDILITKKVYRK